MTARECFPPDSRVLRQARIGAGFHVASSRQPNGLLTQDTARTDFTELRRAVPRRPNAKMVTASEAANVSVTLQIPRPHRRAPRAAGAHALPEGQKLGRGAGGRGTFAGHQARGVVREARLGDAYGDRDARGIVRAARGRAAVGLDAGRASRARGTEDLGGAGAAPALGLDHAAVVAGGLAPVAGGRRTAAAIEARLAGGRRRRRAVTELRRVLAARGASDHGGEGRDRGEARSGGAGAEMYERCGPHAHAECKTHDRCKTRSHSPSSSASPHAVKHGPAVRWGKRTCHGWSW
jgi:hypothetical protein